MNQQENTKQEQDSGANAYEAHADQQQTPFSFSLKPDKVRKASPMSEEIKRDSDDEKEIDNDQVVGLDQVQSMKFISDEFIDKAMSA